MPRTVPLLALLASCGWNNLPAQESYYVDEPLWNSAGPIATSDGVYVELPAADALVLVRADGTWSPIDVGVGTLDRAPSPSPDGATIGSFITRIWCADGEAEHIYVEACPEDELEQDHDLLLIRDGAVGATIALDNPYNGLRWSADGTWAVALIEAGSRLDNAGGVVSLTTILFVDVADGSATSVPVGFAATDVLFDADASRAVVLSQSEVAVVDLTGGSPSVAITYGLTLDADDVVVPVGIELTPDGDHALISVEGDDSLYILDLVNPSVNIKALSGAPSAMAVNLGEDRTILVYGADARVDIVDHDGFDVDSVDLDEPMSHILDASDFSVLWSPDSRDVYRFQVTEGDEGAVAYSTTEYRLQSTPLSVYVSPDEQFAVALTAPGAIGGRYGMEILDLRSDGEGGWRDDVWPYALEGRGLGVAFALEGDAPQALVLQQDQDYVYQFDLMSASATELGLSAPPRAIGAMPDGGFFVTEDVTTGLMAFLDPSSDAVVEAAGFATYDLLGQDLLLVEED